MEAQLTRPFRVCVSLLCFTCIASAQQPRTRAEEIQRQRDATFKAPLEPDTDKIEQALAWANEHRLLTLFSSGWNGLTPTIGGMINGSGMAGGIQFLRADLWGGDFVVRSSARLSTREYQLYDFEVGLPRLLNDRAYVDFYARRRNYAQVAYYGPGPTSSLNGRSNYRLEDTSFDISAGLRPFPRLRLGVVGGLLQVNVGPGTDRRYVSTERIYTSRQTPGIASQSDFLRSGVLAHLDLRDSPYGPKAGGQYYGRFDYYDDRTLEQFSFGRLTAEAQQFIPLFNKKRVIAGRAKTILSYPGWLQRTPFYLQPSLGAADDLRGFRPFRFYDNNSFVMNGEWRWEILSGVEGALFADAGKVFARPRNLNFSRLEKSYGGGLRFRAPMTGALVMRMDVAASREGVQFWFVFNDIFAAPQVRTGRELSPPPGRLP
jgi:outer membrane protein assembly factor BamA